MEMYNPCHPGEMLRVYMGEEMTVTELAKHLGITRANLSLILNKRAGISAMMALKLDEAFGTTEAFWLRMQIQYDLARARRVKRTKIKLLPKVKTSRRALAKELKNAA
jgi:addiction module HigA family antidote